MNLMKLSYQFSIILTIIIYSVNTKQMTRCQIDAALKKQKFDRKFISNWVCLIENESGGETMNIRQGLITSNYGLFGIKSRDWCGKGYAGGLCKVSCESLLDDKLDAISDCAKKVFFLHGFKAWKLWESNCKLKPLPNLNNC